MFRRIMTILCIGCVVIAIILFGLVRYLESTVIFFPNKDILSNPHQFNMPYDDVHFRTSDGLELNGWLIRNPQAKSTMILAHGNAGNIGDRLPKIKFFYDLGLSVFIFDYRGYGQSQGRPSEQGIYQDTQAAYDYLMSREDVSHNPVFIYGASLGGVVAIDLALHRPIKALIVDSTMTSAPDMAKRLYPFLPTAFMSIRFDSIHKIPQVRVPKLLMHSSDDEVIPFAMGRALFKAASEPKIFIQTHGSHNDVPQIATNPQAKAQFVAFLKEQDLL